MTERSARFALPFIQPGQAQKELFHNEAVAALDALVHSVVEGMADEPPADPVPGQCWLVGTSPAGTFDGHADEVACYTSGGWRFFAPIDGMSLWDRELGLTRRWNGPGWGDGVLICSGLEVAGNRVVGGRENAIPNPSGGSTIDAEARAAIDALIVTLKSHGLTD